MNKLKEILKRHKECIILSLLVLIIFMPFFKPDYYVAGDDFEYHISNIQALYNYIRDGGNLFNAKIMPLIAKDFGYGTGIFYPRLSHTMAAIFAGFANGNIIIGMKLSTLVVFIASTIIMYKLVKKVFKDKTIALVATMYYITFPYVIGDSFSRVAFAESFVFMFIPMVILGIYELFYGDSKKFFPWFVIGYVGLINSHLVMSIYITIFVVIYLLVNYKKTFCIANIKKFALASIIILLMSSSFLIPLLQHRSLHAYYVFEGETMASAGTTYSGTFFIPELLRYSRNENYATINQFINIATLVMAVYVVIYRKELIKEETEKNFFKFLLIATILSVWMVTKLFPWIILPKQFIMIQFAWRMEVILAFVLSILGAIAVRNLKEIKQKQFIISIIIIFNLITLGYSCTPNNFNDIAISGQKIDVFNVYTNEKIKEFDMSSSGIGYENEYFSMNTLNSFDYYKDRSNDILVKQGHADITITKNVVPNMEFTAKNVENDTIIELPRLYYLGYTLEEVTEDNEKINLEIYMNDEGFVETKISKSGELVLNYTGTKLGNIANIVSIVTILGFVVFVCFRMIFRNKNLIQQN